MLVARFSSKEPFYVIYIPSLVQFYAPNFIKPMWQRGMTLSMATSHPPISFLL